jgi:hypothetical protein
VSEFPAIKDEYLIEQDNDDGDYYYVTDTIHVAHADLPALARVLALAWWNGLPEGEMTVENGTQAIATADAWELGPPPSMRKEAEG